MSQLQFTRATRKQVKARIALDGPSGGGKTYTMLLALKVLANGGKIAVIDTERRSASLYADDPDLGVEFDVLELNDFNPENYVKAIQAAESAGYAALGIDSLSHAWEGEGGVLDLHDKAVDRQKTKNSYTAWADVTPVHRRLVDAMLQSNMHIVATMRSKMDYVQEKDQSGKTVIRKVGMAPIQRQGMEYEFTLVADMDVEHVLTVSKSRCKLIADACVKKPGTDFFQTFANWLNSGESYQATKSPERLKMETRYAELVSEANALGIATEPAEAFNDEELVRVGKALVQTIESKKQPTN